jgi:hypothetical protein
VLEIDGREADGGRRCASVGLGRETVPVISGRGPLPATSAARDRAHPGCCRRRGRLTRARSACPIGTGSSTELLKLFFTI